MSWLAIKAALGVCWAFLKRIPWQVWAGLLVLALLVGIHHHGVVSGRAEVQAKFDAYRSDVIAKTKAAHDAAKAAEKAQREAFDAIAKQHDKDKADAKRKADKLAADLRAGRERLRHHWSCPAGEAGTAGGAIGSDEAARLREESAARIVGNAAEADAWIRALQEILRAERSPPP